MHSKQMDEEISKAEKELYKTYNRYQVVFDHGDGCRLYDTDGVEYIDFFAGIAVQGLGHHYPGLDEAIINQTKKLVHTSNYFYNEPAIHAAEKLLKVSQMDKVFFTNSGTEAIEGALKIAKRYGYNKNKGKAIEIIAMEHSFHGRSLGALSVTGKDSYREPFDPLIPGVKFAQFNDLKSVESLVTDKTCGIIVETIQGEGGIYPATGEFLAGLRKLADEHDLILIFDEIQCGMGRSGEYFAWQNYGVKPDVMTVAKALGNGLPIGAFLACGKASGVLVPGDHGSTYGGNPLVCAAADKILSIYEEDHIIDHVRQMGDYLKKKLTDMTAKYSFVKDVRGKGLMLGVEFDMPIGPVIDKMLSEEHVVLINAGTNILRLIPPLIIDKADIDTVIDKLDKTLASIN